MEGVIVVWQLDTGKRRYKPRLGSPLMFFVDSPDSSISSVSITSFTPCMIFGVFTRTLDPVLCRKFIVDLLWRSLNPVFQHVIIIYNGNLFFLRFVDVLTFCSHVWLGVTRKFTKYQQIPSRHTWHEIFEHACRHCAWFHSLLLDCQFPCAL